MTLWAALKELAAQSAEVPYAYLKTCLGVVLSIIEALVRPVHMAVARDVARMKEATIRDIEARTAAKIAEASLKAAETQRILAEAEATRLAAIASALPQIAAAMSEAGRSHNIGSP